MQSIIMHLDMNSFFASCEQQDNILLRGKPIGVCEHLGGIIIAPSIEAKRWGIKTGTPVWEAKKLYPKIQLVQVHASRYRHYSKKMVKVVSDYSGEVEQYSIDEVFLDITKQCNIKKPKFQTQIANFKNRAILETVDPWEEALSIAKTIKQRMRRQVGQFLPCSVGLAPTKLVAKIASDLQKPDGLTVIRPAEVYQLYQKLSLTDVPGIGPRLERSLNNLGIQTLVELRDFPETKLVARYGFLGHQLYRLGRLEDPLGAAVEADEEIKSVGHMYTLPLKFRSKKYFVPVLYKLCEMVAARLRKLDLMGRVIHFYLHDSRHHGVGQSRRLGNFVDDGREIFLEAMAIFERLNTTGGGFKLIGVSMSNLAAKFHQQSLFGNGERQRCILGALDQINAKYGNFTVCRTPVLQAKEAFTDSVGFGRIKELAREKIS